MRRHRKAKIIATLGPASSRPETVRALFEAGADVFRLNFSHGTSKEHHACIERIRELEVETGRPIGVLLDLQGPKLRLGKFEKNPVRLNTGDRFRLDLDGSPGDWTRAPLPHPEIFAALEPGVDLLLDDGLVRLQVTSCGRDYAETEIKVGGDIGDHKGVNVPSVVMPLAPLTKKDRGDLAFGLELGVDWVALSFIQRPEDFVELRELVEGRARVLSKLEKPAAIEKLDEIVELSDAVMVARGDLGVELPPEDVPSVQKRIIRACRQAGKPVVVATQMLDSMIRAPVPTRAEASDVATAVYDSADAVMLSGETAVGQYPVEAVAMMDRIISRVECDPHYRRGIEATTPGPERTTADAICDALRNIAGILSAAATVTYTDSGFTSLRAARERPEAPILSLTPHITTARRLSMVWGVHSVQTEELENVEGMVDTACRTAVAEGFVEPGQPLIIAAGMPFGTPGTTNILRIAWVED